MAVHSSYLRHLVTPHSLKLVVDHLAEKILADKAAGLPIDAIAVRGNSGTLVGGALSMATGIPVITIRKPGDNTHSSYRIECDDSFRHYVIVDDLIASGNTIKAIVDAIADENFSNAHPRRLVKVYLYHDDTKPACGNMEKFGIVPLYEFKLIELTDGTSRIDSREFSVDDWN